MIRYLTDARIDAVIDAGYDNLKAKNYADGILEMLNETESYLEDGIPSNQYNYDTETGKISRYRSITVYEAIGAAVIALLCGGGFAASVLGSYRLKKKTYRYPYESQVHTVTYALPAPELKYQNLPHTGYRLQNEQGQPFRQYLL